MNGETLKHAHHFGSTDDGDVLVYFPRLGGKVLIFPRHHSHVFELARGFEDPVDWVTASGEPVPPREGEFRYFCPERKASVVELLAGEWTEMDEVMLSLRYGFGEIDHTVAEKSCTIHFIQEIGGRIQLVGHSVRVDHDLSATGAVEPWLHALFSLGLSKTWDSIADG